jgi:hypothetical protein
MATTTSTDNNEHLQQQQQDVESDQAMTIIDPTASRLLSKDVQNELTMMVIEGQEQQQQEQPQFPKLSAAQAAAGAGGKGNNRNSEYRRVRCPPHRYTPLREHWEQILTPLVQYLKLQVR